MNLMIDCSKVLITPNGSNTFTVEISGEVTYDCQLEHYIDYLGEKYGNEFLQAIKKRYNLVEDE